MAVLALSLFPAPSSSSIVHPNPNPNPDPVPNPSLQAPSVPALIFLSTLGIVNVLGPLGFWWAWRFKTRRGGGWDPAVVRVRRDRGIG